MADETVSIKTQDGACLTHVLTPDQGSGPWPAVILYYDAGGMRPPPWKLIAIATRSGKLPAAVILYYDAGGMRPTLIEMGQRLADAGYVVLVPDLFYRYGPYETMVPKVVFASPNPRAIFGPLMETTDNKKAGTEDTAAFLAYLDTRSDFAGKVGTVGFCMGGGMAITAAGSFPDRVAMAISFHGGRLASDSEVSPHLLAPRIKGEVYVAAADNDASYPPEMAEKFEKALDDADVTYSAEVYEGAAHGWMKPDFPVYDEEKAERGWKEMLARFDRALH
jgi:carboxymethylenebutenolidase